MFAKPSYKKSARVVGASLALGLLTATGGSSAGATPAPTSGIAGLPALSTAFDRSTNADFLRPTKTTVDLDLSSLLRGDTETTTSVVTTPTAAPVDTATLATPATDPLAAPSAPETPAPTPGQLAVDAALTRLGRPYSWGASGPNAFDCSGLTMWAWGQVGVGLGHYTGAQYAQTQRISEAELQPGDLVFYWRGGRRGDPSHVGLYIGDGNIVHAPGRGRPVQIQSIYYWSGASVAFGRI